MRLLHGVLVALVLLAIGPSVAHATDAVQARAAYQRATEAFEKKEYGLAAEQFALADDLAPNPVALESALKAALLAETAALGMELAERAEGRAEHARVTPLAKRARETFASRAGRLKVSCPDERPCQAVLGAAGSEQKLKIGTLRWLSAGKVRLQFEVEGAKQVYEVDVPAGQAVDFRPAAPSGKNGAPATGPALPAPPTAGKDAAFSPPPPPPSPPKERAAGGSPAWFVIGCVVTGALLGTTIWSGIDTLEYNDAFQAGDDGAREAGQVAQLRTNILLGATGVSAAGVVVTAFFTDWGSSEPSQAIPVAATGRGTQGLLVRGRF